MVGEGRREERRRDGVEIKERGKKKMVKYM